jgi:hypothetical protein
MPAPVIIFFEVLSDVVGEISSVDGVAFRSVIKPLRKYLELPRIEKTGAGKRKLVK